MGWAVRRAMGRAIGCAMAGTLVAVPVGGVAGAVSTLLPLASLASVVTQHGVCLLVCHLLLCLHSAVK